MPKLGDRRLVKEWSDTKSDFEYSLLKYEHGIVGYKIVEDERWNTIYFSLKLVEGKQWITKASGDKAWANRIKKHYKLEVEE